MLFVDVLLLLLLLFLLFLLFLDADVGGDVDGL